MERKQKVLVGTALAIGIALVVSFSLPVLAAAMTPPPPSSHSGGTTETYSTSQSVSIAAGANVLLYVACTTSSCSPAKYHSAEVTITVVVQSYLTMMAPTVSLTYWFGAPTNGIGMSGISQVVAVPDQAIGPITEQYDGYATQIANTASTGSVVVDFSFTAQYQTSGT
jgi:hypothetical protein